MDMNTLADILTFVGSILLLVLHCGKTQKLVDIICSQSGNIPVKKNNDTNLKHDDNDVKSALKQIYLSRCSLVYLMIGFFITIMQQINTLKNIICLIILLIVAIALSKILVNVRYTKYCHTSNSSYSGERYVDKGDND